MAGYDPPYEIFISVAFALLYYYPRPVDVSRRFILKDLDMYIQDFFSFLAWRILRFYEHGLGPGGGGGYPAQLQY